MSRALEKLLERTTSTHKKRKRRPRSMQSGLETFRKIVDPAKVDKAERDKKINGEKVGSDRDRVILREKRKQVIAKLNMKPVYKKYERKSVITAVGLTPGLAPVDYNPDESSDEDPYN